MESALPPEVQTEDEMEDPLSLLCAAAMMVSAADEENADVLNGTLYGEDGLWDTFCQPEIAREEVIEDVAEVVEVTSLSVEESKVDAGPLKPTTQDSQAAAARRSAPPMIPSSTTAHVMDSLRGKANAFLFPTSPMLLPSRDPASGPFLAVPTKAQRKHFATPLPPTSLSPEGWKRKHDADENSRPQVPKKKSPNSSIVQNKGLKKHNTKDNSFASLKGKLTASSLPNKPQKNQVGSLDKKRRNPSALGTNTKSTASTKKNKITVKIQVPSSRKEKLSLSPSKKLKKKIVPFVFPVSAKAMNQNLPEVKRVADAPTPSAVTSANGPDGAPAHGNPVSPVTVAGPAAWLGAGSSEAEGSFKPPHQCIECGRCFIYRYDLVVHSRIHSGERPFLCHDCGRQFTRSGDLTKHRASKHNGSRPWMCGVCGASFPRREHLIVHSRTHSGEKPFACPDCGCRFGQKGTLSRHIRSMHAHLRLYVCHVCGARFSEKGHLTVHLRGHTGYRPFQCPHCPRAFTQGTHLTRHLRTHSEEKPYVCPKCIKAFNNRWNFQRHMKASHNIEAAEINYEAAIVGTAAAAAYNHPFFIPENITNSPHNTAESTGNVTDNGHNDAVDSEGHAVNGTVLTDNIVCCVAPTQICQDTDGTVNAAEKMVNPGGNANDVNGNASAAHTHADSYDTVHTTAAAGNTGKVINSTPNTTGRTGKTTGGNASAAHIPTDTRNTLHTTASAADSTEEAVNNTANATGKASQGTETKANAVHSTGNDLHFTARTVQNAASRTAKTIDGSANAMNSTTNALHSTYVHKTVPTAVDRAGKITDNTGKAAHITIDTCNTLHTTTRSTGKASNTSVDTTGRTGKATKGNAIAVHSRGHAHNTVRNTAARVGKVTGDSVNSTGNATHVSSHTRNRLHTTADAADSTGNALHSTDHVRKTELTVQNAAARVSKISGDSVNNTHNAPHASADTPNTAHTTPNAVNSTGNALHGTGHVHKTVPTVRNAAVPVGKVTGDTAIPVNSTGKVSADTCNTGNATTNAGESTSKATDGCANAVQSTGHDSDRIGSATSKAPTASFPDSNAKIYLGKSNGTATFQLEKKC